MFTKGITPPTLPVFESAKLISSFVAGCSLSFIHAGNRCLARFIKLYPREQEWHQFGKNHRTAATNDVTSRAKMRLNSQANLIMHSRILLQFMFVLAAGMVLLGHPGRIAAADSEKTQYYELRIYTTESEAQQQRINDYWQNAAIPAYNRMGIQPVGVFTELQDSATNKIYVLIPCDSLEDFAAIPAKLAADADYQKTAAEFLNAPKSNPAYARFESSLLVAFDGMKRMSLPAADKKPNLFELRTYLSSSEGKGLNKIKMFESGEIPLMKEVGLAPIFYGRTIAGLNMPCLVYMTCGENLDAHKQHWQGFSASPVWKQLTGDPQYKDNVSRVISIMLKRTAASQI
jgi:NIPSNAP